MNDNFVGSLAGWLVIFLTCGYPLSASLGLLLRLPTDQVNFASKAFFLVLALLLLSIVLFKRKAQYFTWMGILVLLFWVLYLFRLGVDMFIFNIKDNFNSNFLILSYAIGACFIPSIALIFTSRYIDLKKFIINIWIILIIINILLLFQVFQNVDNFSIEIFQNRVGIRAEKQKAEVINSILISFYGGLLIVVSVCKLLFNRVTKIIKILILWSSIAVGILSLLLGASRSPIILTIFIIIAMLIIYFLKVYRASVKSLSNFIFYLIVCVFVIGQVKSKLSSNDFIIYERLVSFKKDRIAGYKEERDYEQEAAIKDFENSPILGNHFVNSYDKTYPHNVVLESFMAMGIVGGILFVIIIVRSFHFIFLYSFKYPFLYLV
ncbi:MAG: hypothetical protein IPH57_12780 [Saprospiraceae bacterium]|nr:hypothetical protein [Saprospiraceae bacterium]